MISNNLILSKAGNPALVEFLSQKQPGEQMAFKIGDITGTAELIENLTDRASFDIMLQEPEEVVAPAAEAALADSVLGVMGKKAPKK
jgi:hypothetical protein